MEKSNICKPEKSEDFEPISDKSRFMTREQGIAFEHRQSEPPRQPTEAERELVRMFHATVKR